MDGPSQADARHGGNGEDRVWNINNNNKYLGPLTPSIRLLMLHHIQCNDGPGLADSIVSQSYILQLLPRTIIIPTAEFQF